MGKVTIRTMNPYFGIFGTILNLVFSISRYPYKKYDERLVFLGVLVFSALITLNILTIIPEPSDTQLYISFGLATSINSLIFLPASRYRKISDDISNSDTQSFLGLLTLVYSVGTITLFVIKNGL
jgi:predicted neutral ceramidase superfamily lipid hydrolase